MKSVMVRIRGETHQQLHELAADLHEPLLPRLSRNTGVGMC